MKKNKNKVISMRLTEWEYKMINEATNITKQNRTRFIIGSALEKADKIIQLDELNKKIEEELKNEI